jgi:hypothetical protein
MYLCSLLESESPPKSTSSGYSTLFDIFSPLLLNLKPNKQLLVIGFNLLIEITRTSGNFTILVCATLVPRRLHEGHS